MADLLTSIREQLAARLEAGREAVEECERLRAALRVLDASAGDGRPARSPRRAGTRGRQGRPATKSPTRSTTPSAVAAALTLDADGAGPPKRAMQRRRVRRSYAYNKARHSCGCVTPRVRRRAVPRAAGGAC